MGLRGNRLIGLPWLLCLFVALVPCERSARAQTDGPVTVRNMRPYNLLFLLFEPQSGDLLPAGIAHTGIQLDISNNLLMPMPDHGVVVREDCEYQRLMLSYRKGLPGGTEAQVIVPLVWRNGGITDGILSWWHRLFGIPANGPDNPAGRDAYPKYQSTILLTDSHGSELVDAHNAFGFGDVALTVKRPVLRPSPRSALAVRLGLKLPTGNPGLLLGSGEADAGVCFDGRYNVGRELSLYANAGASALGHATRMPSSRRFMAQYMACAAWRANGRDTYLVQWDGNSAPVRTGDSFVDGVQSSATFAFRRVLSAGTALTLSFSENGDIHNYTAAWFSNIGSDFTATAKIEWVH